MVTKADRMALDKKAREVVRQMTLREKIKLMGGHRSMIDMGLDFFRGGYNHIPYHAGGCERLAVPTMKFVDGPRGVVSGHSTCFPVTMARGASFDPDLEERVGDVIGKEVRGVGGRYFGGVCVNVPYNPGWGRSQEVYTEDSYYMGEMGAALVRGVQRHNVIACVKHYAFNSMENMRFKVNITADKRTEREVFLPHFKRCIDAGAASVMGAYNLYQGDQCCHSDYLFNKVLRDEWGFDGFTISDFSFGVRDTVKGIKGGCDIEMIKVAGSVNPNTALILIGSNVILMSEWIDHVPAVVMGYYPGMEGGNALADIIFGKVNPSGKLPYAVPVSAADLPQVDWADKAQHYGYYHGYQKLDKDGNAPLFPFGFGLSYTSFALSDIRLDNADAQKAVFKATVKNTGLREGAEVVQLYIGFNNSAVDRPAKRFSAFQKVYLAAGAETQVTLKLTKEALAYYNEEKGAFMQEDITYTAFIGNNEKDFAAQIDFRFD